MPTGSEHFVKQVLNQQPRLNSARVMRHALNKNVTFIYQRPKILLRLAQVGDFHVSFRLGLLANTTQKPRVLFSGQRLFD